MAIRNFHLPISLTASGSPRQGTFAVLFSLIVLPRSLLVTVIPLQAHALLGDAQKVSVLYFAVSLAGVCGSLAIPWLVHRLRRRWVFSLGAVSMILAAALLGSSMLAGLVVGMVAQVFAIASLEITLNLYVMDHIPRREISRFEPRRVFVTAGVFSLGPWVGVKMQTGLADWTPFLAAALAAAAMLAWFWYLRLTENKAVSPMKRPPPQPLNYLPRFFGQPRLRLSWVLAVARSSWWSMFFIYTPIYAVNSGLGGEIGGALVSLGSASLFVVPVWAAIGRRFGMRRLLVGGYVMGGLATITVAAVAGWPWLGAAVLLLAAFAVGAIDGAGNVPFLRSVRPLERPEMTTVFATYRDAAQLLPPGIFSVVLKVFELPAVFVLGGGALVSMAYYARFIPRRF